MKRRQFIERLVSAPLLGAGFAAISSEGAIQSTASGAKPQVPAKAAANSFALEVPERKSPTEPLDLECKIGDTASGKRPIEPMTYPYFSPDYKLPFTHIGAEKQLFLDNFMLDHLDGVERVIIKPTKHPRPLLERSGLPWEEVSFNPIVTTALQDPDDHKFKMWYCQTLTGDPYNTGQVLCYAESTDALTWKKPLSEKCIPYKDHKATNIVHRDVSQAGLVLNYVRKDPQRKFLLVYAPVDEAREKGQRILSRVAISPDGLSWTVISQDVPQRHQHESRIIWDEAIQQWVGYSQYSHHWHHGPRVRQVGRQTSSDFIHWSPKEVVLSVDWDPNLGPDREFHEASIRKVGGLYIAIVGESHMEPIWNARTETLRGMSAGAVWRDQFHVSMALYVSRDGRRFQRAGGPEPWVENGPPGSRDYGYACFSAAGALHHNGKMVIPYLEGPVKQWTLPRKDWVLVPESARREHERLSAEAKAFANPKSSAGANRTVGGLILREDGWARLKPTYEHGKALSKQFVFEGDTLKVNADCTSGYIKVELLDPFLKPYPGFSADDCKPVHDRQPDTVWHTVFWNGKSDVRALWNKPVIACFHLHEASLYAFQFLSS